MTRKELIDRVDATLEHLEMAIGGTPVTKLKKFTDEELVVARVLAEKLDDILMKARR